MAGYGVWFGGRNTPICVSASSRSEAISKAKSKKKRGGDNVVKARTLTESEKKTASKGNWVTTRPDGKSKAKSKHKGKGMYGKKSPSKSKKKK